MEGILLYRKFVLFQTEDNLKLSSMNINVSDVNW
jgi:hypothetical protein